MARRILKNLSRKSIIMLVALLLVAGFATFTFTQTKPAAADACPATISYGSTGGSVKQLQNQLNYRYSNKNAKGHFTASPYAFHYPLKVDGIFGAHTRAAVRDYQHANHLKADGIVGRHTWLSLGFTPGCL